MGNKTKTKLNQQKLKHKAKWTFSKTASLAPSQLPRSKLSQSTRAKIGLQTSMVDSGHRSWTLQLTCSQVSHIQAQLAQPCQTWPNFIVDASKTSMNCLRLVGCCLHCLPRWRLRSFRC